MTGPPTVTFGYARVGCPAPLSPRPRCKDRGVPDDASYSQDTPWFAPAEPLRFAVDQSRRLDLEWLTRILQSDSAELLIRSHLQPQNTKDKIYMDNWKVFWRALGFSDSDKVAALMERWLDAADAELAAADEPDGEHAAVVSRFRRDVDQAYNRLLMTAGEPLAWAGPVWSKYGKAPRRVIEALAGSIALHQAGVIGDAELHSVLSALALNPGRGGERLDPDNLQMIENALVRGEPLEY